MCSSTSDCSHRLTDSHLPWRPGWPGPRPHVRFHLGRPAMPRTHTQHKDQRQVFTVRKWTFPPSSSTDSGTTDSSKFWTDAAFFFLVQEIFEELELILRGKLNFSKRPTVSSDGLCSPWEERREPCRTFPTCRQKRRPPRIFRTLTQRQNAHIETH